MLHHNRFFPFPLNILIWLLVFNGFVDFSLTTIAISLQQTCVPWSIFVHYSLFTVFDLCSLWLLFFLPFPMIRAKTTPHHHPLPPFLLNVGSPLLFGCHWSNHFLLLALQERFIMGVSLMALKVLLLLCLSYLVSCNRTSFKPQLTFLLIQTTRFFLVFRCLEDGRLIYMLLNRTLFFEQILFQSFEHCLLQHDEVFLRMIYRCLFAPWLWRSQILYLFVLNIQHSWLIFTCVFGRSSHY